MLNTYIVDHTHLIRRGAGSFAIQAEDLTESADSSKKESSKYSLRETDKRLRRKRMADLESGSGEYKFETLCVYIWYPQTLRLNLW